MALRASLAADECQADGGRPVWYVELRAVLTERLAQPVYLFLACGRGVGLDEDGVAEGDLEVVKSMTHKGLERHGINIIGLDAFHNLVVQINGLLLRQVKQHVAKTRIKISARELEVDLAEP